MSSVTLLKWAHNSQISIHFQKHGLVSSKVDEDEKRHLVLTTVCILGNSLQLNHLKEKRHSHTMKSNNLLLICDVLFRFLPFFLDTGIQIWNAVEINRLATSTCDTTIWEDGQLRNKTLGMRNS